MKPGTPLLQSTRLLDQVRERVRGLQYSLKTEKAYLYRIRFFVRWAAAQGTDQANPFSFAKDGIAACQEGLTQAGGTPPRCCCLRGR